MNSRDTAAVLTARDRYTDLRLRVVSEARANDGDALEDHLRGPVQTLVESVAEDLGYPNLVLAGEISGAVGSARPDYTVTRGGLVIGHIELKAPGAGVDPEGFTGHNLEQWEQLRHLPNMLYTDGIDWILWQDGQQVARATAWTPPGKGIAGARIDAADLVHLLDAYCADALQAPATAEELARTTARLCRVLHDQILGALETGGSVGLQAVAEDWRSLLFPDASDDKFADAYAQTITFGLIAARAAVVGALRGAAERLIGFELQTGPYSVAQFRTGARFRRHSVDRTPRVLLADTLADPYTEEVRLGSIYEPISRERRAANHLKATTPVMVAIGNPPYRERAKGLGGWVESGNEDAKQAAILDDWKPPADWGVSAHVYNMSNLLVYFWRWATWKVLENAGKDGGESPGVVCFVTTAAWLNGDGFQKMRAWLRQWSSEIWVVSLSPEGHQPDVPTRMFEQVQHEIAVVCAVRSPEADETPAAVWFRELAPGTRTAKFAELQTIAIGNESTPTWTRCPLSLRAPFKPAGEEIWRSCPSISDLLPWSSPGVLANRGWPTAQDSQTLDKRWSELISEADEERKRALFKETRDRKIHRKFNDNLAGCPYDASTSIAREVNPCPLPIRFAWRSFDRQWIIPDRRLLDVPRPPLWEARSDRQIHLTCIEDDHPGSGPAVTFTHLLPGLHHYHGRGGRAFPLWRDGRAAAVNLAPGLLDHLGNRFSTIVAPEDVLAYVAAVCSHPAYTAWFDDVSPHTPGLRVPVTADRDYWSMAVGIGRRVIWAHTFGERCIDGDDGRPAGRIRLPDGPRLSRETGEGTLSRTLFYDAEQRELRIGEGTFGNVSPEVHGYEVSGTNVVRSWFNYRRAGRGSRDPNSLESITPDGWRPEWDIELLDILNALTALVALEPDQAELLDAILDGPQITVEDLTAAEVLPVPAEAKKAPKVETKAAPAQTTLI